MLIGIVEMDETYIGGKPRKGGGPRKRGRGTDKTPVVGAVERGSRVTAKATQKVKLKGRHLRSFVRERIKTDESMLVTDEYTAYRGMGRLLPHAVVNHTRTYADGFKHTNTIEGFWALLNAVFSTSSTALARAAYNATWTSFASATTCET